MNWDIMYVIFSTSHSILTFRMQPTDIDNVFRCDGHQQQTQPKKKTTESKF